MQLQTPIQRGESQITEIGLRTPSAGELRGIKLADLLQMDVDAVMVVLPRITSPSLTAAEIAGMDPADLLSAAAQVSSFLLPKAMQQEAARFPST